MNTHGLCWNHSEGEIYFYRRLGKYLIPQRESDIVFYVRGKTPKERRESVALRLPYLSPEEQSVLTELNPLPCKPYIGFSEEEGILVKGCLLYVHSDRIQAYRPVGAEIDCYSKLEEAGVYDVSNPRQPLLRSIPFLQPLEIGGEGEDQYMVLPYIDDADTLTDYLGNGVNCVSFHLVAETMRILTLFHKYSLTITDAGNPDNWLIKRDNTGFLRVFMIDLEGLITDDPKRQESDWYSLINLLMDILFGSEDWVDCNVDGLRFGDRPSMEPYCEPMKKIVESKVVKASPYYSSLQELYKRVQSYSS